MTRAVIEKMCLVVMATSLMVLLTHVANVEGLPADTTLDSAAWLRSYNEICDKDIYDHTKIEEQLIELAMKSPKQDAKKISKHLAKIALMQEARQDKSQLCSLEQLEKFRVLKDGDADDACFDRFFQRLVKFLESCIEFHSRKLTEQRENEKEFGQLSLTRMLAEQLEIWDIRNDGKASLPDELIEFFERKLNIDLCKKESAHKRQTRTAFEENYEKFIKEPCKYLFKETNELYRFNKAHPAGTSDEWIYHRRICSIVFKYERKTIKSANEELKKECREKVRAT